MLSCVTDDGEKISERLFEKYGDFERIFSEDADSLISVSKNPDTAVFIKLALALAKRKITDSFKFNVPHTTQEIEEYLFALFFCENEEKIYAITIDDKGRVTKCKLLGVGDVGQAQLITRKLVSLCESEEAKGVILAHNHPAASPEPSEEDVIATKRIKELLDGINVKLCLHYIYSGHKKSTVMIEE